MDRLTQHDVFSLLLSLGVMLAFARVLGELAKRVNQPAVLGEMLAGIMLGPTVLGQFAPSLRAVLFSTQGHVLIAIDSLTTVAIVLFLLVAGLEVDLSTVFRQGKTALSVSALGIIVPFALGGAVAWYLPGWTGWEVGHDRTIFTLFFATALSISALPVIAKTLMDLNLYRSDLGMVIIAAAIFNDLVGWIIFAVILGMLGSGTGTSSVGSTILLTLAFTVGMLTIGRWLIHRSLPWLQAHTSWPGGVLAFALALAFFGAAFTEWIGIHAIFGSFIVGVALGDSTHLREETRATIDRFVSFIFAPIFFASIGLRVNFIANFDPLLVATVLVVAIVGKVLGCGLGARLVGMPKREAWAVGFGMNARGMMEIVLGLLALQFGVIGERLFVALVVMAIVTSMMSGPAIQRLLHSKKKRRFTDILSARSFTVQLGAADRRTAIEELARLLPLPASIRREEVIETVWNREQLLAPGLGHAIALPHARIEGLPVPMLALGISRDGIDFDAPDGKPAKLVFLLLTPVLDDGVQLEILADIARTFSDEPLREKARLVKNYVEFLALMKSERRD